MKPTRQLICLFNIGFRTYDFHVAVHWLLVTETVTQSLTTNYVGYVFTSPGFSANRNQDEAQTFCTLNGSQLLEINSSYVQNLTVRFLSDTGVQFAEGTLLHTNGIRNDGNWNWVSGGQDIRRPKSLFIKCRLYVIML